MEVITMSHSVIVRNVSKKYKMYKSTSERLLDMITPFQYGEDFYALRDVSFEANTGDVVGIVGVNGSGKSTLSNIIAGVIKPTAGTVEVQGQVSLIAINSGLNNELTGRENIELKCLMLGFSRKEIRELEPEIIAFADIGKFIDQPVKNYSSGMRSRLGFAISVCVDPDILVIDEALSVGDQIFADKCLEKMNEFKRRGKTIFFISHSLGQVKKFCAKALWLEYGEVRGYGSVEEILPQYEAFLNKFKSMSKSEQEKYREQVMLKQSGVYLKNANG
jgi:teichoic acid transport system ATP-binding protein